MTATSGGCRCDVYDSTSDQVYSGYLKESEGTYGPRWVAAVDATAGQTMRYGGKTAVGYYSSSHGGHSESNAFVWGSGQVPYLRAVDDWARGVYVVFPHDVDGFLLWRTLDGA